MSSRPNLPRVEPWEIESTSYSALSAFERQTVDRMMDSLIDIGRAGGLNLWAMNPRANATREKLSQWIVDRRDTSTPGTPLPAEG